MSSYINESYTPTLVAGGNIGQCVFVMPNSSADFGVLQATANSITDGISTEGAKYPPESSQSNVYAYESGDPVKLYGPGKVCLLAIGSGGCVPGSLLEADANGRGVIAQAGHYVGARALEAGSDGDLRYVKVVSTFKA